MGSSQHVGKEPPDLEEAELPLDSSADIADVGPEATELQEAADNPIQGPGGARNDGCPLILVQR